MIKQIKSIFPLIMFFSIISCTTSTMNEALNGNWEGTLRFPSNEMRIVFKFNLMLDGSLQAKILMPDANGNEIQATKFVYEDSKIYLEVPSIKGSFEGKLQSDGKIIKGYWKQGTWSQTLNLKKGSKISKKQKPQTPVPPYPYSVEDVTFTNKDTNSKLAGTLTSPKGGLPCPVVILIPGVGAHDRDYTMMNHRPFLVLADYLTRKGVAVLRYDERGVGASTGDRTQATSKDFADDVIAWIEFLRKRSEVNPKLIGLIGHSEGGTIASLVAAKLEEIAFIIIMGSPGLSGVEYNIQFEESMGKIMGLSEKVIAQKRSFQKKVFDVLLNEKDIQLAKDKLLNIYKELNPKIPENSVQAAVDRLLSTWFYFNLTHDPAMTLRNVKCPILALFGEKDVQVPPDGNAQAIKQALELGNNRDHEVKVIPGLNHFFQNAKSGAPAEYGQLDETISTSVLKLISDWILCHIRNKS